MENTHAEKLKVYTCMEHDKQYNRLDNMKETYQMSQETNKDQHNFKVHYKRDITCGPLSYKPERQHPYKPSKCLGEPYYKDSSTKAEYICQLSLRK